MKTVKPKPRSEPDNIVTRNRAYVETLKATRDPRAAVRAYCAGNRWLTENAKGVGNW